MVFVDRTENPGFGNKTFINPNAQIGREELARLARNESVERVERGIYRNPQAQVSEYESLILASLVVPG